MKLVRSGVLALATVLAVLVPSAAHAGSYDHNDAAGDVVTINDDFDGTTPAPGETDGDILSSHVLYSGKRITMQIRYASLEQDRGMVQHYFSIVTNKGKFRTFALIARKGTWEASLAKRTGRGKAFDCKGIRWSIKYYGRSATLSVPRRCLDNPRWVRVAMAQFSIDSEGEEIFLDDAMRTGFDLRNNPAYGAKVWR